MTTIRVKLEELETVAKHVPDAEDACRRARTSLSWELPSLVMEIPGIGSAAIQELTDELLHWLRRYEEKLNEAEELLYRTAAAIRQADQTLADNMKEFGLELLGWYDLQRVFGEYDPITGERISAGDRLLAGGMLLLSVIPPAKGAGVAGKAVIKGAKAAETAADVSKWISKTRNVLNVNKIKGALQTIYHQVIKGPITETIRSFKKQWEQLLENVGSVLHLQGSRLAAAGVGAVSRGPRIGIAEESINMFRHFMIKKSDEAIEGMVKAEPSKVVNVLANFQSKKFVVDNQTFLLDKRGMKHILERHHPKYWDGSIKAKQTFLRKNMSIDEIVNAIETIIRQNRDTLLKNGTTFSYQIKGTYNGIEYVVGFNKGRVGQFYPLE
ncbi:pre-toxin TG domain-containing protein [Parageobacillus thermoglucosidasius]|uniref:pre-toxin TG domain-containing protein n=1 Tax=Parageobacillus thermoglucosidasius TaxID=1426 RepID=UPI0021AB1E21|nr:pre-toxin TG domain-containing protein [Parageobacillus thermoglucosidasius]